MARPQNKLSARGVAAIARPGRHGDGGGLYLDVSVRDGHTRRAWVYLFTYQNKLRAMGLGGYPRTSLAQARAVSGPVAGRS
jgi:Arm DNA-binding domain